MIGHKNLLPPNFSPKYKSREAYDSILHAHGDLNPDFHLTQYLPGNDPMGKLRVVQTSEVAWNVIHAA